MAMPTTLWCRTLSYHPDWLSPARAPHCSLGFCCCHQRAEISIGPLFLLRVSCRLLWGLFSGSSALGPTNPWISVASHMPCTPDPSHLLLQMLSDNFYVLLILWSPNLHVLEVWLHHAEQSRTVPFLSQELCWACHAPKGWLALLAPRANYWFTFNSPSSRTLRSFSVGFQLPVPQSVNTFIQGCLVSRAECGTYSS